MGSKKSVAEELSRLVAEPAIERAFAFVDTDGEQATRDVVDICEIEAPPFGEDARADWVRERFAALGLEEVGRDTEGNVLGLRPGTKGAPVVVLSAHLDTIFPPGTDCRVRREGARLYAPGIADDSSGVAALLAVVRALDAGGIRTESPILFLATVGEEGEGNLRGARHFFGDPARATRVAAFISLDGPGIERVTHRALGSRRYEVRYSGPGGHSWGDFGIVNPIHALGRAISRLASFPVPLDPRTTFNVGHIEGGASVNTIAESASMRVDLRSVDARELERLEEFFKEAVQAAAAEENRLNAASGTRLETETALIGERPSGETPADSPLVTTIVEASRMLGIRPVLDCSSTDSNVPISLGIPAVTIGCGGTAANTHTLAEWYDPTNRETGLKRIVLILSALAGLSTESP